MDSGLRGGRPQFCNGLLWLRRRKEVPGGEIVGQGIVRVHRLEAVQPLTLLLGEDVVSDNLERHERFIRAQLSRQFEVLGILSGLIGRQEALGIRAILPEK